MFASSFVVRARRRMRRGAPKRDSVGRVSTLDDRRGEMRQIPSELFRQARPNSGRGLCSPPGSRAPVNEAPTIREVTRGPGEHRVSGLNRLPLLLKLGLYRPLVLTDRGVRRLETAVNVIATPVLSDGDRAMRVRERLLAEVTESHRHGGLSARTMPGWVTGCFGSPTSWTGVTSTRPPSRSLPGGRLSAGPARPAIPRTP
jgi:hypothetical protein